jgi:hypothetical protein
VKRLKDNSYTYKREKYYIFYEEWREVKRERAGRIRDETEQNGMATKLRAEKIKRSKKG